DMSKSLPVDLTSDTIEINKVSIKNDGISGMFIAENPYNKDFLSLIIFLVDEDMEDKSSLQEGDSGEIYVYDDILIYSYNPLYADDVQFVIHVDDIEIRGLYK
ncbi:MAG: M1 family peptidase, partial [Tissierellia bacterium]|nr:M1 family peptidase [Tissierellia bacterium]